MTAWIVDRRLNPTGKSLVNSQRFIQKAKANIKQSIDKSVKDGKIEDMGNGEGVNKGAVTIANSSIQEPTIRFDRKKANYRFVLPGNKNTDIMEYIEKDSIGKPQGGSSQKGVDGSPDGEGADDFTFTISPEEWAAILFEDMELPNLEEKNISEVESIAWNKAGFKTSGSPANISIRRTLRNSFGRRVALHRPKSAVIEELEDRFLDPSTPEEEKEKIRIQLEDIRNKLKAIPYIDTMDVRYYNLESVPKPIYNACMYCLMDVSGSMTEHMKDLAKRFYILLYRFLKTKYPKVEVVFIRHTHEAKIVDEQTFFYDTDTGGTVVSKALYKMLEDMDTVHSPKDWNIYVAQCSDGDNTESDSQITQKLLEDILPEVKYYAYLETQRDSERFAPGFVRRSSDLWTLYQAHIADNFPNFAMKKASTRKDIFPVFSELFSKKNKD